MPKSKPEPRYRWEHPFDWLRQSNMTYGDLLTFIQVECTGDQIQDYFQPDMEKDGYFEDLNENEEDEDGNSL